MFMLWKIPPDCRRIDCPTFLKKKKKAFLEREEPRRRRMLCSKAVPSTLGTYMWVSVLLRTMVTASFGVDLDCQSPTASPGPV